MAQDVVLRSLTDQERKLLDLLLRLQFPGAQELRVQARSVQAVADFEPKRRAFHVALARFVVTDADAPRARVRHAEPVGARVHGYEPKREVLLAVRDGLLAGLDVVDINGALPDRLPDVDELRPPSVNYVYELA